MIGFFRKLDSKERNLFATVTRISGKKPKNFEIYKLALRHSSVSKQSNERLEFLGDAVLGSVVADFLFKKFPFKTEGFLTELRSRIVKRESLNTLSEKIGLSDIVDYNKRSGGSKSVFGNALEAFVGSVYLDHGYEYSCKFILGKLIKPYINIDDLIEENRNFKSTLIEWAQKNNHQIEFKIVAEEGDNHKKTFNSVVLLNYEIVGKGAGFSKKRAEQAAAEKACQSLEVYKNLE